MKKKLFLYLFMLIAILIGGLVVYNNFFATKNTGTKNEVKSDQHSKEFAFETAEGTIEIDAYQALTPRGFAGATDHIFYLKDSNLYYYVNDGEDELYAENVESIYYESEQSEEIVVKLKTNATITKKSPYLIYLKEGEQIFNFETAYGLVKIVSTKAMTASGSSGASNNIFYIKDNNLYYYVHEGEDELLAENVLDMTFDIKKAEELIIKIDNNSKIINTNPYILYMKEEEQIFNFTTAYVPSSVRIVATKATSLGGFAGATNHIFYIKNNNLYYYVHEGEDELLAEKVLDISFDIKKAEYLIVKIDENSKKVKDNKYVLYMKEGEQIFNFSTAYGTVKIVATKAMTASGSAGASNQIFYIKNNNLYKYVHEGEDELLAEKVLDISFDIKKAEELIIKIDNNSKIINTNPYILYMKDGEQILSFSTAYGTVKIVAKEALTPRGFSGATNHIFYLKDNNLYYYVHEGEDELYAENIESIYYEGKQSEEVVAKLNSNSKIIKESSYIIYK